MVYGDVATMPWGEKERFEPGAFGNVGSADVILNVQHCRDRMIARTGGGGLTLDDNSSELVLSAILPNTQDANDVIELIRTRVLRGLSVEFIPTDWRTENNVLIIEKAELKNVGVVDRPAYPKSRLKPRSKDDMNKEETQELVRTATEAAIKKALENKPDDTVDTVALARSISESLAESLGTAITEQTTTQIESVLKERDDAEQARKDAEEKTQATEAKAKTDREEADSKVEARTNLILMVRDILPDNTDLKGKNEKEILVMAVGDEVKDADKKSEDYLTAKVEDIVKRRADAFKKRGINPSGGSKPANSSSSPVNVIRMVESRRATAK